MANKKKPLDKFSDEYIRKHRTFPTLNTILIGLLVALQILLLIGAFVYDPQPQDIIKEYEITVDPLENGSLDISYRFVWQAMDETEELTWVEIGMPNQLFSIKEDSLSDTVASAERFVDGDYVSVRLDLTRAYHGGETLEFSFQIRQENMLCRDEEGYFYELIPGWFNATPVEHYIFRWKNTDGILSANTDTNRFGYRVWEGRMDCGTYVPMQVRYSDNAFANARTADYQPFDESGVTNELVDSKITVIFGTIIIVLLLVIAEVYLIDSLVSYDRGRGFLTGYGHRVHLYGRVNPRYSSEKKRHAGSGGSFRGGGCACACACACAGGGRAGCSQKDGYINREISTKKNGTN